MKIVTAKEVASLLKLTESTIYNLAAAGKLSGFRIGNSWRFDMDTIIQQIKKGGQRVSRNSRKIGKTAAKA